MCTFGSAATPDCATPAVIRMVCDRCWESRLAEVGGDENEALRQLISTARSLGWEISPKREPKKRGSAPKKQKPQGPQLSLLGENV